MKASPAPVLSTTSIAKGSSQPQRPPRHQRSGAAPSVTHTAGRPGRAALMASGSWLANSQRASSAAHLSRLARSSSGQIRATIGAGGALPGARPQKPGRQFTSTARAGRSRSMGPQVAPGSSSSNPARAAAEAGDAKGRVPLSSQRAPASSGAAAVAKAVASRAWSAKPAPRSPRKPPKLRSPARSRCTSTVRLGRSGSHCRALVFTPRPANRVWKAAPMLSVPSRPAKAAGVPSRARPQATFAGAPPNRSSQASAEPPLPSPPPGSTPRGSNRSSRASPKQSTSGGSPASGGGSPAGGGVGMPIRRTIDSPQPGAIRWRRQLEQSQVAAATPR